ALCLALLHRTIEPPDIGARAEGWIGSRKHQHPQRRVLPTALDFPFELLAQLTAKRVPCSGIIQGQDQHTVLCCLRADVLERHNVFLSYVSTIAWSDVPNPYEAHTYHCCGRPGSVTVGSGEVFASCAGRMV